MCLGVPAEVVELPDPAEPRAVVAVAGVRRTIATDLLLDEALAVGDWVLVHVGFALARIDAAEAARTLDEIRRLGADDLGAFGAAAGA